MFQANDKDPQITLPEAVLVILVVDFEQALVSRSLKNCFGIGRLWTKAYKSQDVCKLLKSYFYLPMKNRENLCLLSPYISRGKWCIR